MQNSNFNKNLNYSVLGAGKSGKSAINFLNKIGVKQIFVSENSKDPKIENYLSELKSKNIIFDFEINGHSEKILNSDIIIASPGINTNLEIFKKINEKNIEIISELELGYRALNTNKILAITGTNGKTTTVNIIHELLKIYSEDSFLCGNVGTPITEIALNTKKNSFVVVEISSYQLELIKNFHAKKATITNVTPDHLYRYGNIENYAKTKFNIFNNQTKIDFAIINIDDDICKKIAVEKDLQEKSTIKTFSLSNRNADIFYNKETQNIEFPKYNWKFSTQKLKVFGLHNVQNIIITMLMIEEIIAEDNFKKLENFLETFTGIEHRLEFVAEINGIKYINDSKSTNYDSTEVALKAFSNHSDQKNVILLLGGQHKGFSFESMSYLIKQNVKNLMFFGEAKEQFATELKEFSDIILIENDLQNILKQVQKIAQKGDVVLFSPGCASFDQFQNFEHRGQVFKKLVKNN